MLLTLKKEWFSNIKGDALAGIVVALALIPEAIAFSIIAGVDPKVGLYASFCIATVISFVGGRPAMISAATGAMALLMVTLVKNHGLQYLFATTILTGIFQIIAGYIQLGDLMRFVSKSVVTGFVNALAILIFMAQMPELIHQGWQVYALTGLGLLIIYLFPYLPKIGDKLPSPLVCIVIVTLISIIFHVDIRTVGDMGKLPDTLPVFLIPDIPLNLETLLIITPYALGLSVVGLLESMMTATIVDEFTDTDSDKNKECRGQGIANICSGFLGGMAGCAMIGQSIINVKSGGRTRLSTLIAGIFLLVLVVFLDSWLKQIPMAALVAVMIMVSIGTFSWDSIVNLKKHPMTTNIVMLTTVVVVVLTHNLAIGVFSGVLIASLFFANKISKLMQVLKKENDQGVRLYQVSGQIFFASSAKFLKSFDLKEVVDRVIIDVSSAHFWDISAVGALDQIVIKFRREGVDVEIIGMNEATKTIVGQFAIHDKSDSFDKISSGH